MAPAMRPAAITLFVLLVLSQVGVAVFSLWEPAFDGKIHYAETVDLGGSYWPMNVLLGGPSYACLLYTSPSPRDGLLSRMPSSA